MQAPQIMESSDVIRFSCESCQAVLTVPVEMAGVKGPCPKCGAPLQAPQHSRTPKSAEDGFGGKMAPKPERLAPVSAPLEPTQPVPPRVVIPPRREQNENDKAVVEESEPSEKRSMHPSAGYVPEEDEKENLLDLAKMVGATLLVALIAYAVAHYLLQG